MLSLAFFQDSIQVIIKLNFKRGEEYFDPSHRHLILFSQMYFLKS